MPRPKPLGIDDKGRKIFAYGAHGRPVCGHKTRDGSPCQNEERYQNGRCRRGGGLSSGPRPKHGRRSMAASKFQKRVAAAMKDPEVLASRRNAARIEVLIQDAASKIGETSPAELWALALSLLAKAEEGDEHALARLRKTLENGLGDERAREEIVGLAEAQRKHIEAENKRLVQLEAVITLRQFNPLAEGVISIIREVCRDESIPRENIPAETGQRIGNLIPQVLI
jgi:hypothetical protein